MKIIKNLRSLPGDSLRIIRRTPPLVFAMAVLSLGGFIGASTVLVRGFRMVENTITVTGASTESFESDMQNGLSRSGPQGRHRLIHSTNINSL